MEYLLVAVIAIGNLGDFDVQVIERYSDKVRCQQALKKETLTWPRVRVMCLAKDYN